MACFSFRICSNFSFTWKRCQLNGMEYEIISSAIEMRCDEHDMHVISLNEEQCTICAVRVLCGLNDNAKLRVEYVFIWKCRFLCYHNTIWLIVCDCTFNVDGQLGKMFQMKMVLNCENVMYSGLSLANPIVSYSFLYSLLSYFFSFSFSKERTCDSNNRCQTI